MALSIGGLGSGLDTQAIIAQLMQAEAGSQNKLKADKSALTVKSGAWLTLGTLTKTLMDKAGAMKTAELVRLTSSASSAPTVATATSTANATPGSLTFRVTQLATRHQVTTAGLSSATAPVGAGSFAVSSGTAAIGAAVTVEDAAGVTGKYAVAISSASGVQTATVNGVATAFGTDATTGLKTLSVGGTVLTFADGPKDGNAVVAVVKTSATTTLNELSTELGKLGGPATSAVINDGSATPYRLVMSAANTGTAGAFVVTASTSLASKPSATPLVQAQNAKLQIGSDATTAITVERSSNTVTDLMDGVTINLVKSDVEPVTVTVKRDDDAVVSKMKGLQDSLNGLVTWIATNSKYDVAGKRGGPMVGDAGVRTLASAVASAMQTQVAGSPYPSAGTIGLSPNRNGTYDLDETKLKAALLNDPDAVGKLISTVSAAVAAVTKAANEADGVVKNGQGSTATRTRDLQNRIDAWDLRLQSIQQRYNRQFSALDTAMARLNSQNNYLGSQLRNLGD